MFTTYNINFVSGYFITNTYLAYNIIMKKLIKVYLFTFTAFLPSMGMCRNYLHQMISTSIGMVNVNVTENASSLSGVTGSTTETSSGGSASASIISLDMIYEFQNYAHVHLILEQARLREPLRQSRPTDDNRLRTRCRHAEAKLAARKMCHYLDPIQLLDQL